MTNQSTTDKLIEMRLNEWTSRFTDQKASSLSVRQWCEQNQVSIHTYNYWKHALKEELADQLLPDIATVSLSVPVSSILPSHAESPCLVQSDRENRPNCTAAYGTNPHYESASSRPAV